MSYVFTTYRHKQHKNRVRPELEQLEARDVPSVDFSHMQVHPMFLANNIKPFVGPLGGPGYGYSPQQMQHAFGVDQVTFSSGTIRGDGTGTTIAIVDAYDQPTMLADLQLFDASYGIPDPPSFQKMDENGGTSYPPSQPSGWGVEISLDVEWAHAIAPGANILLVEANAATYVDLMKAEVTAAKQPGVVVVSNSWGGGEFTGETAYDKNFRTPLGHTPVTFCVASGDSATASYPATSPNVVAVGGTALYLDGSGNITGASGWSGSGGGPSTQELIPAYQKSTLPPGTKYRANPDVAWDAASWTGVASYESGFGWYEYSGTSYACPQFSAIIAIADQGRATLGENALDSKADTLPTIYNHPGDFYDVTQGGTFSYPCTPGYDYVTGLGMPAANLLIPDLLANSGGGGGPLPPVAFKVAAPATVVAGTPFSVTVSAIDQNNAVVTTFTGTVSFSCDDLAAILPGQYTFNTADNGAHAFDPPNGVTMFTAGTRTLTVTDTADNLTGSATIIVQPGTVTSWAFVQQPLDTHAGAVITPAVTLDLYDQYGNLETTMNSGTVSMAIGNNPSNGVLSGTTTVNIKGGVASFTNLSINAPGSGYTLVAATSVGLPTLTSAAFTILSTYNPPGTIIENFETFKSEKWYVTGGTTTYQADGAAVHDGSYGLDITGNDWIYRIDPGATVRAGDSLSVWTQFINLDGRAYFGFGASAGGTLAFVAAPNTNQLQIVYASRYATYSTFGSASYLNFQPFTWYRLQVDWNLSGVVTGRLFATNGTTLLGSVSGSVKSTGITSGGIAFRGLGTNKFFDTVIDASGLGGGTGGGALFVASPNGGTATTPAAGPFTPFGSSAQQQAANWSNVWSVALAEYEAAHHRAHPITIPIVASKRK
jgi:hypothetical protein